MRASAAASLQAFWIVALDRGTSGVLPGKRNVVGARLLPVLAEFLQQPRRERHESLLAPFAVPDVELHPRAVDVGDLQVRGFAQPQARRIQGQQHRAMFENGYTCDQPTDFLGAQHRRQLLGTLAEGDVLHDPGPWGA